MNPVSGSAFDPFRTESNFSCGITERSWCTLTRSYCSQMVVASLFRETFEISEHLAALYSPACAQTQRSTRAQRMLLMFCVCLSFLAHCSTRTSSPPRLRYSSVLLIAFYHGVQQENRATRAFSVRHNLVVPYGQASNLGCGYPVYYYIGHKRFRSSAGQPHWVKVPSSRR